MLASTISQDHLPALLSAAKAGEQGARDFALVCIAVATGARPSEVAGMTWRAVSDATGAVTGRIRYQTRKGGHVRDIALNVATIEALQAWAAVAEKRAGRDWLFPGPNGRMVDSSARALISAIARRAGLDASGYSLRHLNFAMKADACAAAGGTVEDFRAYTGHKGISTPAVYMRANAAAQKAIESASLF